MKLLLNLILFATLISCYENQEVLKTSETKDENETVKIIRDSTEIFFDSFAYEFISQIKAIDTNDILIESLSKFENVFINFISRKKIPKDENIIYLIDMPFGVGPVATYKKHDASFVKKQVLNSKDMFWSVYRLQNPNTLNNYYEWIEKNPDFKWENFKTAGFGCFVTLSAPIFNKSKTKAVIMIGNQCHETIGLGYVYLYELNENGNWKKSKERQLWIS